MNKRIEDLLREHPFFDGLDTEDRELIAGCGRIEHYQPGDYIAREGDAADHFYIIRKGRVSIETFVPQHSPMALQTLKEGEILGWSWLFPPYRWTFDVRAVDNVHVVSLDGSCLRGKCEEDTRLGYELMKRFARIMTERLKATRMQIMDVYGDRK